MKNILKCAATVLVTGALVCIHKDAIEECCKDAKKACKKINDQAKAKPSVLLFYDSTPCNCTECHCNKDNTDDNNENNACDDDVSSTLTDSCCGPSEATGCGCDQGENDFDSSLEEYRNLFKKYEGKAKIKYIDTSSAGCIENARFNDYTDRFGIEYLPCVLVLTPKNNLIAKLEAPGSVDEVEQMLGYCL